MGYYLYTRVRSSGIGVKASGKKGQQVRQVVYQNVTEGRLEKGSSALRLVASIGEDSLHIRNEDLPDYYLLSIGILRLPLGGTFMDWRQ